MSVPTGPYVFGAAAAVLAAALLVNSLFPLPGPEAAPDLSWDGGRWSATEELTGYSRGIPYEPRITVFQGKLYLFYGVVSKNTGEDDLEEDPGEYALFDVAYRTLDGRDWSAEQLITSPDDGVSNSVVDVVAFNGSLYVVFEESWISDEQDLSWNYSLSMLRFDGQRWAAAPSPLGANQTWDRYGRLDIFVFAGRIWAVGDLGGSGRREFDGAAWSPLEQFALPMDNADQESFLDWNGALWALWTQDVSVYGTGQVHQGVFLARYDGYGFGNITNLSASGGAGGVQTPAFIPFDGGLAVCWESTNNAGGGNGSRVLLDTYAPGSGLGDLTVVSSGKAGQNFNPQPCVYNDRLYVLWKNSVAKPSGESWRDYIRSFDRERWSPIYALPGPKQTTKDFPHLAVYDGRLWASWKGFCYSGGCSEVMFTSYYRD
jgi:hypothetical protein